MDYLILFLMTILQNASFTLVSRARNSDSVLFHGLAAVASNGIWFMVVNKVVAKTNTFWLGVTYTVAAVIGSILMHYLSMKYFENWFKKRTPKKAADGTLLIGK
jgi:hypothetical protein